LIIKNKEVTTSIDVRQLAGNKQEQDVAFFLRRAFKDHEKVFVFNDLRIEHNNEVAQIDHLVLYVYGFILIESKSITGEVKINTDEEWSRSYNGKWAGMRSPIKQVELQQKLLRELLHENRKIMLDKIIFGKLQTTFGGRCWNQFCAISSNAITHREHMPKSVSDKLVKSEFLIDKLNKIIPGTIKSSLFKFSSQPWFVDDELKNICDFLMGQHKPISTIMEASEKNVQHIIAEQVQQKTAKSHDERTINSEPIKTLKAIQSTSTLVMLSCKKCNNTVNLQAAWGKYGYYVKCPICETNTAMKSACPSCNSKNTKVSKKKAYYHLICQECSNRSEIFVEN
jgi:hypothetical protein